MKWEAHQASGFFGLDTGNAGASVPRYTSRVDITQALAEVDDVLEVWAATATWGEAAPPFSGGVWDSWPARMAQGLAVCRAEMNAVRELLLKETR